MRAAQVAQTGVLAPRGFATEGETFASRWWQATIERSAGLYPRTGFAISGEREFRRDTDRLPTWVMLHPTGPSQPRAGR